jgi:putative glutamine amidotransferase
MQKILLLLLIFNLPIFAQSEAKIKIAISKGSGSPSYLNYSKWLESLDKNIEVLNLYGKDDKEALEILSQCSGLILSGGPDVNPAYFGKGNESNLCEIDGRRDTLEFQLIQLALKKKMPILAICRGMQIFNVSQGGSLITDLPTFHPSDVHHQCGDKDTCFHQVKILESITLPYISHITNYTVNTNHHQAIDKLADDLNAYAYSNDGIIEAYEWKNPQNKSFLIAVQWHPERLDKVNPELSDDLGKIFIEKVKKYKIKRK